MANEVVRAGTSFEFSWTTAGAGTYQYHISAYCDFSDGTNMAYSGTGTVAGCSGTISDGSGKYYRRWRFNGGAGYGSWREVSSFFMVGTTLADVTLADEKWVLINANDTTDKFAFEENPIDWRITPQQILRSQERNMQGELLTQFITTKATIELNFNQMSYIGTTEKAEFKRFYNIRNDKYIAVRDNAQDGVNYTYNIWKVEFSQGPQLEAAGNLSLLFEEV